MKPYLFYYLSLFLLVIIACNDTHTEKVRLANETLSTTFYNKARLQGKYDEKGPVFAAIELHRLFLETDTSNELMLRRLIALYRYEDSIANYLTGGNQEEKYAKPYYLQLLALHPSDSIALMINFGLSRSRGEEAGYPEAIAYLEKTLDRVPTERRVAVQMALADMHHHLEQWPATARYAESVLQVDSSNINALYLLAQAADAQKQWPYALRHWERLMELDFMFEAHYDLAAHYNDEGIMPAGEALRLKQKFEMGQYYYYSQSSALPPQALYLGQLNPLHRPSWETTSFITDAREYQRTEKYGRAIVTLKRGLKKGTLTTPQRATANSVLAAIYLDMGAYQKALEQAQLELAINKERLAAYYHIAAAQHYLGNTAASCQAAQKIVALAPQNAPPPLDSLMSKEQLLSPMHDLLCSKDLSPEVQNYRKKVREAADWATAQEILLSLQKLALKDCSF